MKTAKVETIEEWKERTKREPLRAQARRPVPPPRIPVIPDLKRQLLLAVAR